MSPGNSKPSKDGPLIVHFLGEDKERLRRLAAREHRSLSNMAAKLLRDGMDRLEQESDRPEQTD
ncbi:hypothetical protein [Nitrosospira sp. Nsp1]|uniref:ribbon-helix-helix domain-containing protein n=1 Tax=Nitrosospira sp. Nsp1 TaxID=136547 RepID=UPI000882DFE4|nr:hypothetical protein [Nitrosospira sp. Nsp1]SCX40529.1 CopG-like RHH_1 or ribbon-helix-helix domain-containing protein, RHH_5 [Nitrosospira sp. Nsp1]